jgi:hypothetical protein
VEKQRSKELVRKENGVVSPTPHKPEEESHTKARPSVRTASKKQFDEAHRKTTTLHAGLFRRLAE